MTKLSPEPPPAPAALKAVVAELELHASAAGWDRPATLYALVDTAELARAEPQLGLAADAGGLTPIEQESLGDRPLDEALARVAWPPAVIGCALVHEVFVLPQAAEDARPANADALEWAQEHADRREVRMTVAVLRDGARAAALRVRPGKGEPDTDPAFGEELAPNLAKALLATFD